MNGGQATPTDADRRRPGRVETEPSRRAGTIPTANWQRCHNPLRHPDRLRRGVITTQVTQSIQPYFARSFPRAAHSFHTSVIHSRIADRGLRIADCGLRIHLLLRDDG